MRAVGAPAGTANIGPTGVATGDIADRRFDGEDARFLDSLAEADRPTLGRDQPVEEIVQWRPCLLQVMSEHSLCFQAQRVVASN